MTNQSALPFSYGVQDGYISFVKFGKYNGKR